MQVFPYFYNRNTTWYPANRHGIPDTTTNDIGLGLSERLVQLIHGQFGQSYSRG